MVVSEGKELEAAGQCSEQEDELGHIVGMVCGMRNAVCVPMVRNAKASRRWQSCIVLKKGLYFIASTSAAAHCGSRSRHNCHWGKGGRVLQSMRQAQTTVASQAIAVQPKLLRAHVELPQSCLRIAP